MVASVRSPAVAGMFYPADAGALREMVVSLFDSADGYEEAPPKAVIAPHAGYVYSGQVAANVYKALQPVANTINKVVLLGPSHRVAFKGLAVPSVDNFATPLGYVNLCQKDMELITSLPFVNILDEAHAKEHSLEVQLPFLQEILGNDIEVTPVVVGDASAGQVSAVLELLWGGPDTLIVISSDLSHYHKYDVAKDMDLTTSNAIIYMNGEAINPEKACGSRAIKGLLHLVKRIGIQGKIVDLCNSGDTAGDKERVVGYGAYHFGRLTMDDMIVSPAYQESLKKLARESILYGLQHHKVMEQFNFSRDFYSAVQRSSFVTLEIDGNLRGCIGSLVASKPLPQDVMSNAYKAAFEDHRFSPLTPNEFENVDISISVLSPASKMNFTSEEDLIDQIRPGIDGLIFVDGNHRGTFLPSVWKSIPDKDGFLKGLKRKAGLSEAYWSDTVEMYRYTTQYF